MASNGRFGNLRLTASGRSDNYDRSADRRQKNADQNSGRRKRLQLIRGPCWSFVVANRPMSDMRFGDAFSPASKGKVERAVVGLDRCFDTLSQSDLMST